MCGNQSQIKFIVFSFSQFFLPPTSVCHLGVVYSLNAVHTGSFSGDYIVKEIHFKLICRFTVFLLLFFVVVVVFFFQEVPEDEVELANDEILVPVAHFNKVKPLKSCFGVTM